MLFNDGVDSASDPCARVAVRDPFHLPSSLAGGFFSLFLFLFRGVEKKLRFFFPADMSSSFGGGSMAQSFARSCCHVLVFRD
jgi:hypothetical protein